MKSNDPNKTITIKDIARVAKVSLSTVSMVLNGKRGIGEDTRYRVLRVIQALNFKPNQVARSLVKRRSNSVAMLITNTRNPIFPEIAEGVDEILKQRNYSLNIISTYDDEELEAKEIEMIQTRGIDGLITSAAILNGEKLVPLVKSGFPVVCVLRRIYDCDELDFVIVDNVKGGYLAVEHLIRLGRERIGIIKGPQNNSTGIERFEGAMFALRDYGVTISEDLIHQGDYFKCTGYLATTSMIKGNPGGRPDAIFSCNDDMALGAFEAIFDMGGQDSGRYRVGWIQQRSTYLPAHTQDHDHKARGNRRWAEWPLRGWSTG